MEDLLTIQQVVTQLKISDETIYRYIRLGKLRAIRVGGLWRIPESELERFLYSKEED